MNDKDRMTPYILGLFSQPRKLFEYFRRNETDSRHKNSGRFVKYVFEYLPRNVADYRHTKRRTRQVVQPR